MIVSCNYCGRDDANIIYPAGTAQLHQIVRCNHCGLMYANPRNKEPDCIEIAQYDPQFNPLQQQDNTRINKERLQIRDYTHTKQLLNQLYPQRGKLLEIGSSLGYLLADFRQDGWNVQGVEPFYQCCRYAREQFGLEIHNAILETAGLPAESFDVVLLNHVIEHVPDPLKTLLAIWEILKPGGHVVIETPRYDTLMFWLLGRRERSLRCPGHIYFFTTDSLRRLYEDVGFRLVELNYVGRSLTVERLIYNLAVVCKSPGLQSLLNRLTHQIRQRSLYLNLRDMQRVCVQKAKP